MSLKGLQFYVHFGSFCPQGYRDEIYGGPFASGAKSEAWRKFNSFKESLENPNNSLKKFCQAYLKFFQSSRRDRCLKYGWNISSESSLDPSSHSLILMIDGRTCWMTRETLLFSCYSLKKKLFQSYRNKGCRHKDFFISCKYYAYE